MTRVVINPCYGGFGLSHEAILRYAELKGIENFRYENDEYSFTYYAIGKEPFYDYDIERDDPILIRVVEELGEKSWGQFSKLKIVEIPDDVDWTIEQYDGLEWVSEVHRTWGWEVFVDSNFWVGISAGVLLGTIIMGLTFIGINSNRILLDQNNWKCSQSRILEPDNVDRVECIQYRKVIKNDISG